MQTLLRPINFSSGCLPTCPRDSLHKTCILGFIYSITDKNSLASDGSPPCQVGLQRLWNEVFQVGSLVHSELLMKHGPNGTFGGHLWLQAVEAGISVLCRADELLCTPPLLIQSVNSKIHCQQLYQFFLAFLSCWLH